MQHCCLCMCGHVAVLDMRWLLSLLRCASTPAGLRLDPRCLALSPPDNCRASCTSHPAGMPACQAP